jgi:hypothetical protein
MSERDDAELATPAPSERSHDELDLSAQHCGSAVVDYRRRPPRPRRWGMSETNHALEETKVQPMTTTGEG